MHDTTKKPSFVERAAPATTPMESVACAPGSDQCSDHGAVTAAGPAAIAPAVRHVKGAALVTALSLSLLLCVPVTAGGSAGSGFELTWSTIDGGGGTSTGGAFVLTASIGQADAGTLSGGDFVLRGGFWEPGLPPTACPDPTVIADMASRYIEIQPDPSGTDPVAFHIECGTDGGSPNEGWVQLTHVDYDDGGGVLVNIGKTTADCADADFLTADGWTSNGANALYVTGFPVCPSRRASAPGGASDSRPTVTARCADCAGPDADAVQPDDPTWVFCDSSGDGQTTFFADLFKQFSNTAAAGGPNFEGPDRGIEVDTQGNWKDVPDQQVTFFADIFKCFGATAAGGGDTWTGPTGP